MKFCQVALLILASLVVVRCQTTPVPSVTNASYFHIPNCLSLYAKGIYLVKLGGQSGGSIWYKLPNLNTFDKSLSVCQPNPRLVFSATNGKKGYQSVTIDMTFEKKAGFWMLSKGQLKIVCGSVPECTAVDSPITAPWLYSPETYCFKCSQTEVAQAQQGSVGIEFTGLQLQPYDVTSGKFSDNVNDCVGFFSIGVLTTLTVTLVLILILSYALSMITGLENCDKYDDPKQKLIQLGGHE